MSTMFSKPKTPEMIIPATPPPTTGEDTAAKEAAARETERIKKKRAIASTIKTSELGLETPPTVLKEKLGQ